MEAGHDVSAADIYFIYFRCWPGFTDRFPYGEFNSLPTDEVGAAIRSKLAAQLWVNRTQLVERRRAKNRQWHKARRQQAKRVLGPPMPSSGNARSASPRRLQHFHWGKGREKRFIGLAACLGWHSGHGAPIYVSGKPLLFSPRIWLAIANDLELAETIATNLSTFSPRSANESDQREILNPRFGIVSAGQLSKGEQAAIQAGIARLRCGTHASKWDDVARPFLPVADSIASAWQVTRRLKSKEEQKPTTRSAVADDNGKSSNGRRSTAPRKRGRRSDTDTVEDQRIFDAWRSGQHKTYAALARALGADKMSGHVRKAIDRHRKRLERARRNSAQDN